MYLRSVTLQNFRSFKDEMIFENLKNLIILIGPNGVGKSNFLKALEYIHALLNGVEQPFSDNVFDHETDRELILKFCWELTISERKSVILGINDDTYHVFEKIDLEQNQIFKFIWFNVKIRNNLVESEEFLFSDQNGQPFLHISGIISSGNKYQYRAINLDAFFEQNNNLGNLSSAQRIVIINGTQSNRLLNGVIDHQHYKFGELLQNFFNGIIWFRAHREAQKSLQSSEDHNLEDNGSNMVRVLNTKYNNLPVQFEQIKNVFQRLSRGAKIFSPLRGDKVTLEIQEEGLASPTNIQNMSTGFEQSLILLTGVETAKENQIICIEEPEIHLHSNSQRELFNSIRDKAKTHQFIITTHSPIFTTIEDNAKTFLISKLEGSSIIYEVKDKENLKIIKEQLGLRYSDIYDNDAVIFIEGESEFLAFPIVANTLGYLHDNSYKLFNLRGKGNVKNVKQLLDYLKDSDRKLYLLLDNDSEVRKDIDDLDRAGFISKTNTYILDKDFEDLFDSERIIRALQKVYNDKIKIELSKDELEQQRKSKKVATIIQEYLNKNSTFLSKPALAEELAQDLAKEIDQSIEQEAEGSAKRIETEFEKIIKDCMSCVGISSIYAPQYTSL